jgi:hypothetical protein
MIKPSDTIGNRTRELPVCSAVPQPQRHRVPRQIHALAALLLGIHWTGGWMGQRVGLDAFEARKSCALPRLSNQLTVTALHQLFQLRECVYSPTSCRCRWQFLHLIILSGPG